MAHEGAAQVWRVEEPVRRVADAVSILFIVIALGATAVGLSVAGSLVMWALAVLVLLSVWRWFEVPYLALTPDGVVVRGAFSQHTVEYDAIRLARPGLHGLLIETTDHGAVTAWAVQKSKLAEWRHRRTRADNVVAQIMDRAHDAHPDGS